MPFRTASVAREGRPIRSTNHRRTRAFSRQSIRLALVAAGLVCVAAAIARAADNSADAGEEDVRSGLDGGSAALVSDGGISEASAGAGGDGRSVDFARAADVGASERPSPAGPAAAVEDNRSVVTARRTSEAAPREDVTAAASVVFPGDSPRAFDDLGALMLQVPGANVTRRGGFGSFATISLRGANPDEVRVYVDGIPLNQAVGGAVDVSTLPLGDVERVEVYRGSSPIAFGESALGGIVAITTRTPGTPHASARAGVGSFRTTFVDANAGGAWRRLRLYVGLHALRAEGDFPQTAPNIPGGYQPTMRENNDLSQVDGVLRADSLPARTANPARRGDWHLARPRAAGAGNVSLIRPGSDEADDGPSRL